MRYTQMLIFEITDQCNRGREHARCPNSHPDRWVEGGARVPMTDEQIVEVAVKAYSLGFEGMLAWHHYCEPLMAWPRLRRVLAAIRQKVPQARSWLWTNGDLFPDDLSELDGVFQRIMVTNYAGRDQRGLASICPQVEFHPTTLDGRLDPPAKFGRHPPCIRPYLEMIFDYYGHVRTCCMDWRGETSIGNIHDAPFEVLWNRWLVLRDRLASSPMSREAPLRCLACGWRYTQLANYLPEIADRAQGHINGERPNP